MMIEIKIENIFRGERRACFKHGEQGAACPIQWLDGITRLHIFFEVTGDLFGTVCGLGDGAVLDLAEEGIGGTDSDGNGK